MQRLRFHLSMFVDSLLQGIHTRWTGLRSRTTPTLLLGKANNLVTPVCFAVLPIAFVLFGRDAPDTALWMVATLSFLSWGGLAYMAVTLPFVKLRPWMQKGVGVGAAVIGLIVLANKASTPIAALEAAILWVVFAAGAVFVLLTVLVFLLGSALMMDAVWDAFSNARLASERKWEKMSAHERIAFAKRYKTTLPPQDGHL